MILQGKIGLKSVSNPWTSECFLTSTTAHELRLAQPAVHTVASPHTSHLITAQTSADLQLEKKTESVCDTQEQGQENTFP